LVDKPKWKERYLQRRLDLGLDCDNEASHVGDVVQSWRFSRAVSVPFGQIPRWISYRLLSRSTIGEIYGIPKLGLRAHAVLKRFIDGASDPPLNETADPLIVSSKQGREHLRKVTECGSSPDH
jgi:hypothetical protein